MLQLGEHVSDDMPRVRHQEKIQVRTRHVRALCPHRRCQMELVALMGCKNFASACCGLPFCRAKVRCRPPCAGFVTTRLQVLQENVTVSNGITLYKCSASRPHRCSTFSWRFMSQAQFRHVSPRSLTLSSSLVVVQGEQTLTCWLRDAAVAAILGMSADEFSLLSATDQQDTVAARRSGGQYMASVTCERPTGDFNRGKPVLYCTKLERVHSVSRN